jgi:hypothetical protein
VREQKSIKLFEVNPRGFSKIRFDNYSIELTRILKRNQPRRGSEITHKGEGARRLGFYHPRRGCKRKKKIEKRVERSLSESLGTFYKKKKKFCRQGMYRRRYTFLPRGSPFSPGRK